MTTQIDSTVREKMLGIIGGVQNLPTPPIVFTQIEKVLNNPSTSAYDVAAILQEDAAMSAKVLKMTNSAYYGLTRTVESVKQAVVIIGMDAIRNLVLSASVFDAFSKKQIDLEFQDYFWRHSLATAFAARLLARQLDCEMSFDAEAGFSSGLLHDVGKMVISVFMPDEFQKIKAARKSSSAFDMEAESAVLGYNHTHVGALLGEEWRLPANLVEAIEFHHFPQVNPSGKNNLPYLVHLATYLAHLTFDVDPDDDQAKIEPIPTEVLADMGIAEQDIMAFVLSLREEYLKAETFVEMAKGSG